jgi:hypothetical protein
MWWITRTDSMLLRLVAAWCLMALCVVAHAAAMPVLLRWLQRSGVPARPLWPWTKLFVHLASAVVLVHLAEIAAWAFFYAWQRAMPDVSSALYFSAVTYTTTGYGDLVLAPEWRLVGAVEALTGILMCGWSTAFFVAVVGRSLAPQTQPPSVS